LFEIQFGKGAALKTVDSLKKRCSEVYPAESEQAFSHTWPFSKQACLRLENSGRGTYYNIKIFSHLRMDDRVSADLLKDFYLIALKFSIH
jgi:hypothetical protein